MICSGFLDEMRKYFVPFQESPCAVGFKNLKVSSSRVTGLLMNNELQGCKKKRP